MPSSTDNRKRSLTLGLSPKWYLLFDKNNEKTDSDKNTPYDSLNYQQGVDYPIIINLLLTVA
jgi:hypothetical protein